MGAVTVHEEIKSPHVTNEHFCWRGVGKHMYPTVVKSEMTSFGDLVAPTHFDSCYLMSLLSTSQHECF